MSTTQTRVNLQADEQAIRAAIREYLQAVASKDPDAAVNMFTDDAVFLFAGMPLVRGQSGLRSAFAGLMQTPGFSLTFEPTDLELSQAGDMAYELGTYRLSLDDPEGHVDDTGKYLTVWRKVSGRWKIAADAPSSDLAARGAAGAT